MKQNKAFTLIEIMVAIAIIAIMAGVVLVSMKGFAAKGRSAKALGELSSAIPSMVSCKGNGYAADNIKSMTWSDEEGGNSICVTKNNGANTIGTAVSGYGFWPKMEGDLANYKYVYYNHTNDDEKTPPILWYFAANSGSTSDNVMICCNQTINGCEILPQKWATCDGDTPSS